MTKLFTKVSASMDSPGELSFVSEHDTDTDSDSSDTSQRQKKEEEEVKKKMKKKKKSEGRVAPTPARAMAANPVLPSGSGGRKTSKIRDRRLPPAGQTNRAFEPDIED